VARGLPEVEAVFTTAGDPDALVWIKVRDVAHLTTVIDTLRRDGNVSGTKTLMVLDTWRAGTDPV
jgi:Lrp/AsnC family leucine-responsive transcriptional regulator